MSSSDTRSDDGREGGPPVSGPPRRPVALLAVLVAVLLVTAGCLGVPTTQSATPTPAGDAGAGAGTGTPPATDTPDTIEPNATDPLPTVDCPDGRDRYRSAAVDHLVATTNASRADLRVLKGGFVDYPLLGTCFYHAKVLDERSGDVLGGGFYVVENGTVVDRAAVERRAERAYRERYGKLSPDLARRVEAAAPGERLRVTVRLTDVDRTAARRAVDGGETPPRQALEEEIERRVERKTDRVADRLRATEGVTVESAGALRVEAVATPAGIERVEDLESVARLTYRPENTPTALPAGTSSAAG